MVLIFRNNSILYLLISQDVLLKDKRCRIHSYKEKYKLQTYQSDNFIWVRKSIYYTDSIEIFIHLCLHSEIPTCMIISKFFHNKIQNFLCLKYIFENRSNCIDKFSSWKVYVINIYSKNCFLFITLWDIEYFNDYNIGGWDSQGNTKII